MATEDFFMQELVSFLCSGPASPRKATLPFAGIALKKEVGREGESGASLLIIYTFVRSMSRRAHGGRGKRQKQEGMTTSSRRAAVGHRG